MTTILNIKELNKHFEGILALNDFNLTIEEGTILGIIGSNGAGKTTLFNAISGFLQLDGGDIRYKDESILGYPSYQIARSGISRTFQDLRLIMKLTVLENVLLSMKDQTGENIFQALLNSKKIKKEEEENKDRARALLKKLALEGKEDDLAENLSYGQQKLLSLSCCLASKSDLLLLDEPVAGVHPEVAKKILEILKELKEKEGKTILLIEHDLEAMISVSDRVVVMDGGRNVIEGEYRNIINNPKFREVFLN